jgi:hypothetical protein
MARVGGERAAALIAFTIARQAPSTRTIAIRVSPGATPAVLPALDRLSVLLI